MNTQQTIKNKIRQQVVELRPNFQTLEKMSAAIVEKFQALENKMGGGSASFQGLELFREAKTVGAYIPLPDEVDVTPLFQCLEKQFYIPAFDEASGGYRLAEYTSELKKGRFGIPEPANPVFAPKKLDLILVPGVAFDRAGNRLGRGGGFYDRLLPLYHAVRIGICFDFQYLETVPSEPHDCRMDVVVSS